MATAEYIFICTLLVIGGVCFVLWLPLFIYNVFNEIKKDRQPNATIKNMKKYVDLGLPSGTLWASDNEEGYYTYDEAVAKFVDRLPTEEQLEELINKCTWKWNKNGYTVTGPNGKSIFLPAAGYRDRNGETHDVGSYGYYWSSTHAVADNALNICFKFRDVETFYGNRRFCFSVRLIDSKTDKK